MTGRDLRYFKKWFSDYTQSFYSPCEEDQKNILLKVEHTRHVCENVKEIIRGLCLSENEVMLAETIALFHDIGRYTQYARYKTFRDADSRNHGHIGVQVLTEEKVLRNLPGDEEGVILKTVKFHNAFAIPQELDEKTLFYLKLIRDADKLDIFRVFMDYYESPREDRASATAFGLQDTPGYSQNILFCIARQRMASYRELKNENDFKLMKLSWIFDINFESTLNKIRQLDYVGKIAAKLPRTDEIVSAVGQVQEYIAHRISLNALT